MQRPREEGVPGSRNSQREGPEAEMNLLKEKKEAQVAG